MVNPMHTSDISRRAVRLLIVSLLVIATVACSTGSAALANEDLQASDELTWYRGNMHTHSHWSDGDDYLEMIALWYHDHGYQFLVYTDHNVLANLERWINVEKSKGGKPAFDKLKATFPELVEERTDKEGQLEARLRTFAEVSKQFNDPGKYLLIQGEEISDRFKRAPIHLNVSNSVELIPPMGGDSVAETIQNNVRAAIAQRERTGQPMIIHLNHPNFGYAVTAEDLMLIRGERFFEVYNGHPGVHNSGDHQHAGTERIWDILLTRRLAEFNLPIMFGIATDDGHNYHNLPNRSSNPGRGWVMVLAKELSAKALIDALEAGHFYASSGVTLQNIASTEDGLTVQIKPVRGERYQVDFIGTRRGYDAKSEPVKDNQGKELRATRRYSQDIGETLKSVRSTRAFYRFRGDEIYVRARITSSAKHPNPSEIDDYKQAWTQPVPGPAAPVAKQAGVGE